MPRQSPSVSVLDQVGLLISPTDQGRCAANSTRATQAGLRSGLRRCCAGHASDATAKRAVINAALELGEPKGREGSLLVVRPYPWPALGSGVRLRPLSATVVQQKVRKAVAVWELPWRALPSDCPPAGAGLSMRIRHAPAVQLGKTSNIVSILCAR